jgi:tRNA (mo5U34)-methyltransferase
MTIPSELQIFKSLLNVLESEGLRQWRDQLINQLTQILITQPHGDYSKWESKVNSLPEIKSITVNLNEPAVTVQTPDITEKQQQQIEQALRGLIPWRKGPYRIFDTHIDTEWHSDWKWDRVLPHLSNLRNRKILDVGCGSGYHCWRMLGEGATRVIGIDPNLLFLNQFQAIKKYAGPNAPIDVLPIKMEDLPPKLEVFDTTFSMGVLYHRRSPIDHLIELKDTLIKGGELVLETLIIEGALGESLIPKERYAMMRNVWFIPSSDTLHRWLERAGFCDIRLVEVNATTIDEQRSTNWMHYQSLSDFLNPSDPSKTVEGYPAPLRATFIAKKPY